MHLPCLYNNHLYLVYKGTDNSDLYMAYYDGLTWYSNLKISSLPGGISPKSDSNPSLASFNNLLYAVYKGDGSNDIYTAWFDGTQWYGNRKISDQPGGISPQCNYSPGTLVFSNKLYLVYKQAHSATHYTAWFDGARWYGNQTISDQPVASVPHATTTRAQPSYQLLGG